MTIMPNNIHYATNAAIAPSQSITTATPPDWREFAHDILTSLGEPQLIPLAFARLAIRKPEGNDDETEELQVPPVEAGPTPEAEPKPEPDDFTEPANLDALFELFDEAAEQRPIALAADPPDRSTWRPRVDALLAAFRIAKTFGSAEALRATLGLTAGVVLLETGFPALDQTTVKLTQHLLSMSGFRSDGAPRVRVLLADDAAHEDGGNPDRLLGFLSGMTRRDFLAGIPLVLVTTAVGVAPAALRDLKPITIPLAPLNRDMLTEMMLLLYAGDERIADAESTLPEDAPFGRLTPNDLAIALRHTDPADAVRAIMHLLEPKAPTGPGLADFPLPQAVRAPLEQILADLDAWRAGEIPWRDVSRGILLVGPPGSGKTELPRLIARDAGIEVMAASLGKWRVSGARSSDVLREMRAFFARAASSAPCLVFIDELDAFGDRARPRDHNSNWTDSIVGGLLECLDGYETHEGVVVMAATNHLDKIDAAIRRPGRFDQVITLDYPTPDLMPQAIRWQLGDDLPDADLSGVAAAAIGMSGAAIAAIVRAARGCARNERRALCLDDVMAEIRHREPPLPARLRWRVAVHEAGHAIVGAATGIAMPQMLAIKSNGGVTRQGRASINGTRAEIETALTVDLAGRTAEHLVIGSPSAGAGGTSQSDLARATLVATALEASFGLGQSLIWRGTPEDAAQLLAEDAALRDRVAAHLRRAEARALTILKANRPLMIETSKALEGAGILMGDALDALISRVTKESGAVDQASPMITANPDQRHGAPDNAALHSA